MLTLSVWYVKKSLKAALYINFIDIFKNKEFHTGDVTTDYKLKTCLYVKQLRLDGI